MATPSIKKALFSTKTNINSTSTETVINSPERKKGKPSDNADTNMLDKTQIAMVDVLMSRMSKMMDDKLPSHDSKTQQQLKNTKTQIETVAETTEQYITSINQQCADNREELKSLKENMNEANMTWPAASSKTNQRTTQHVEHAKDDDTDDDRHRQIIIHGFDQGTDETTIKTSIRNMLSTHNFIEKVEDVYTFSESSNIGVMLFHRKSGTQSFFKRMRGRTIKLPNDKNMSWTTNDTFEQLLEKGEGDNFLFTGEALEVKTEVDSSMKTWLAKHNEE